MLWKKLWPGIGPLLKGLHDCMSLCQHCILDGVLRKLLFLDHQTGFSLIRPSIRFFFRKRMFGKRHLSNDVCPAYGARHEVGQSAFVLLIWRTSMTSSYRRPSLTTIASEIHCLYLFALYILNYITFLNPLSRPSSSISLCFCRPISITFATTSSSPALHLQPPTFKLLTLYLHHNNPQFPIPKFQKWEAAPPPNTW